MQPEKIRVEPFVAAQVSLQLDPLAVCHSGERVIQGGMRLLRIAKGAQFRQFGALDHRREPHVREARYLNLAGWLGRVLRLLPGQNNADSTAGIVDKYR